MGAKQKPQEKVREMFRVALLSPIFENSQLIRHDYYCSIPGHDDGANDGSPQCRILHGGLF